MKKPILLFLVMLTSLATPSRSNALGLKESAVYLTAGVLAWSIYDLTTTESKPEFVTEGEWSKLRDIKLLRSQPKEWLANANLIYKKRFVGQMAKDGHITLTSDGGLKQGKKCPPAGFLGNAHVKLKSLDKGKELGIALAAFTMIARRPTAFFDGFFGWKKELTDQEKHKQRVAEIRFEAKAQAEAAEAEQ